MLYLCRVKLIISNQITKKMEQKTSYRTEIREMKVGAIKIYPIEHLRTIRVTASEIGLMLARQYKTSTNKKNRTITVTRTA